MSIEAQAICYAIAFVCFVVAVVLSAAEVAYSRINLIAAGLAAFTLVYLWTALEAL